MMSFELAYDPSADAAYVYALSPSERAQPGMGVAWTNTLRARDCGFSVDYATDGRVYGVEVLYPDHVNLRTILEALKQPDLLTRIAIASK